MAAAVRLRSRSGGSGRHPSAGKHETDGDLGIDARPRRRGIVEFGKLPLEPAEIENLIDPDQNVVVQQQVTKRSGNAQLRLSALLPAQHLDDPTPPATTSGSKET